MQKAMTFDKTTAKKTLKGAIIAGSGVMILYTLEAISKIDFGEYSPIVAAISSIFINAIREFIQGKRLKKE